MSPTTFVVFLYYRLSRLILFLIGNNHYVIIAVSCVRVYATMAKRDLILVLDIGTTSVRSFIYDGKAQILSSCSEKVAHLIRYFQFVFKLYDI